MNQVVIEKLDHFGRGIAKVNNKIVFVPNTLKGDVVVIEIVKDYTSYSLGKVIKYIERVKRSSPCKYSNICGGCHLIEMNYQDQLKFKVNKIVELFKKNLGIDIKLDEVISDRPNNYRNKINLHVQNGKVGFYTEESHDLVEIDECYITKKEINDLLPKVKDLAKNNNIDEVMIRYNNGLILSIKGNVSKDILLKEFSNCNLIYLNNKVIKDAVVIENVLNKKFRISPKSFFQVNTLVCSKMFSKVRSYIKDKNYHKALDLYCGTGVIGIIISDLVDEVVGIEVVSAAIEDANYNKKINEINNVSFICDKVENRIDSFKDIDLVIVDPPRSGLDNKSIENIIRINPYEIIYVSCDPNTLMRDLKKLNKNYDITNISIADMFPNTYHVECVSVLHRKSIEK